MNDTEDRKLVFALIPTDGRQFDLQTSLLLLIGIFEVSVFYKQPVLTPDMSVALSLTL